jgi:hypothetical protein
MPAPRFQHLFPVSCLLVACGLLAGGCGGTNYASSTVTGRVTIDGAPVPKGYVTFSPAGSTPGPVVAAEIHDGEYHCEKVPQGTVQVTFIAQAAEPTKVFLKAKNMEVEVPKDILPPSCQQGQDAEVKSGKNELNFDLKSK